MHGDGETVARSRRVCESVLMFKTAEAEMPG
jgi:hypothetical protein